MLSRVLRAIILVPLYIVACLLFLAFAACILFLDWLFETNRPPTKDEYYQRW